MGKSIIQDDKQCYFCGKLTGLECHHVFGGVANRPISEKYGLKVWLCHDCHTGTEGAQYDKMKNLQLKQDAQYAFERTHSRNEWMKLIGKNYL
jgi:ribosomal protein L37AE/L43A